MSSGQHANHHAPDPPAALDAYVVTPRNGPRPLADDDADMKKRSIFRRCIKRCCCCGLFGRTAAGFAISLTALVVGIILLVLSQQAAKSRQEKADAAVAALLQEEDAGLDPAVGASQWNTLVSTVSGSNETFIIPDSPQYKALQWMILHNTTSDAPPEGSDDPDDANVPVFEGLPDWRIRQRYALAVVYYSFSGDLWTIPDHMWLDQVPRNATEAEEAAADEEGAITLTECLWSGVECSDQLTVSALSMSHDGFVLEGTIPSELSLLTALQHVEWSGHALQGSIPEVVYTELSNLKFVDFSLNGLTSIDPAIQNWKELEVLAMGENRLQGTLPTELIALTKLTRLRLVKNELLSGDFVYESVGNWTHLEYLETSFTNLTGTLSTSIGMLTDLQLFGSVQSGQSGTIPSELGRCTALTGLAMGDSAQPDDYMMTGTLPSELGNLSQLTLLAISYISDWYGR